MDNYIYMTIQILSNWIIKIYRTYGHNEKIMLLLYIVGFLYMFVGVSRWSNTKRYMHIVALIIYFFLESITLTIANYIEELLFNMPYAADNIILNVGEFWRYTIIEFIIINIYCGIAVFVMNKLFKRERLYTDSVGKRMYWISQAIIIFITDMGNYVRTMELIGANDIELSGEAMDKEQLEEIYKVDLAHKIGYVDTNVHTIYSMANEYLEEIAMYCNRKKLTLDIQADIEELDENREMILCIVLKSIFTELIEGRIYNIEDNEADIRLEIKCKAGIDIKASTSLNYTRNRDERVKKKLRESKKVLN